MAWKIPESKFAFTFPKSFRIFAFPHAKPMRHPAILNVLESEWNSTPTSLALFACKKLGARYPSNEISLYAASWQIIKPCLCACSIHSLKKSGGAQAPVGLLG